MIRKVLAVCAIGIVVQIGAAAPAQACQWDAAWFFGGQCNNPPPPPGGWQPQRTYKWWDNAGEHQCPPECL